MFNNNFYKEPSLLAFIKDLSLVLPTIFNNSKIKYVFVWTKVRFKLRFKRVSKSKYLNFWGLPLNDDVLWLDNDSI
jgi:hypothetical protein